VNWKRGLRKTYHFGILNNQRTTEKKEVGLDELSPKQLRIGGAGTNEHVKAVPHPTSKHKQDGIREGDK